jgi:hypothetical protein
LTEVEAPVRLDWRSTPADYEAALSAFDESVIWRIVM